MRIVLSLLTAVCFIWTVEGTGYAQMVPVGTPGPYPGMVACAPVDTACFHRNTNIYCRAIGAKPGRDTWAQCVLARDALHSRNMATLMQMQAAANADATRRWQNAARFLQSAGAPPAGVFSAPPGAPRSMNCSVWRNGVVQCQ
jgi:hypothetical protein